MLRGLVALSVRTPEQRWLSAAHKGATWLASSVDRDGLWPAGDYKSDAMPSYYSYAASALLDVGLQTRDKFVQRAAERVLDRIAERCGANGAFAGGRSLIWSGVHPHDCVHASGFLESAEMLRDWTRWSIVEPALQRLIRFAELRGGAARPPDRRVEAGEPFGLPHRQRAGGVVPARMGRAEPDLRLVNAAAKLVDYVCDTQRLRSPLRGVRGGVGGSAPIWGRYMTLRYPNWSAKYHCDALMTLIDRLRCEA
jgi:hypothetical protein